ncbi:hypothetical protein TNCV_132751 [Trichonephila clavipes]|nr:hypothetical protein TNCV_132751 [Trichonephila clavipes]
MPTTRAMEAQFQTLLEKLTEMKSELTASMNVNMGEMKSELTASMNAVLILCQTFKRFDSHCNRDGSTIAVIGLPIKSELG